MRYLGGKQRIARELRAAMEPYLRRHRYRVWEPFCGGLNFSRALTGCHGLLSDKQPALIALYRAYRAGWEPPAEVTPAMYAAAKRLPDSDPLKAFCGFGLSYSGKWFEGFAGQTTTRKHFDGHTLTDRPAAAVAKSLAPLRTELAAFELACTDFLAHAPRPTGALIYCDPPYTRTTTGYGDAVGVFDHDRFWSRAKQWARHTTVLVSEYRAPVSHEIVWRAVRTRPMQRTAATDHGAPIEKLVRVLP